MVAFMPLSQMSFWTRPLKVSQLSQPMKQPCEYQKQACALLHSPVVLLHPHLVCSGLNPSISRSMAFRLGGFTRAP